MADKKLYPFKRYVVRFWQSGKPGKGRVTRAVTLGGKPPVVKPTQHGVLVVFSRQETTMVRDVVIEQIDVISRDLVRDVVIEQQDQYEEWHQTGTFDLDGAP